MITVEYLADLKEAESDTRLATLLGVESALAPFDRLVWWQALEKHCGIAPLLAVAREGEAVAVLPLAPGDDGITSLANWYSFRTRPVISPGTDALALLRTIANDLHHQTHRLTLTPVPDEDGSAELLFEAFRTSGWLAFREACDTNHVLHVNGRSYAEYIATRPSQLRTTLKRKAGKLDIQVLTAFDPTVWQEYEDIYRESWKPGEGSPSFLRAIAQVEGKAGRLRLGIARTQGRAVAAQFWTVEAGTAFIHKLAHRQDAKPLSPGTVLSAALFAHVIDRDRVTVVDFGTGDEPYKRDWMEDVRPRYRLELYRAGTPANWPRVAKAMLHRLAAARKRG